MCHGECLYVTCSRVSNVVVPAPPSVALRAPPSLACPAATKEPSVTGLLSLGGFVFFSGITGFETAVVYGFYFFLSYGPYRSVFSVYLSRPMPRVHPRTMMTYRFLRSLPWCLMECMWRLPRFPSSLAGKVAVAILFEILG